MADIFGQIKREYVEPVDDKLLTEAIKGMVASLDPHSAYLDEKDFKELQEGTRGRFAGLGIEISQEEAWSRSSTRSRTPRVPRRHPAGRPDHAHRRQARARPLEQAVKRMRGEPGTKVTLTIYRKSEERTFPVSITRADPRAVGQDQDARQQHHRLGAPDELPGTHRDRLGRRLKEMADKNPNLKGIIWTCATTAAACCKARSAWPRPSCPRIRSWCRPTARCRMPSASTRRRSQLPPVVARGRSAQGPAASSRSCRWSC
jgi:carboxyl-terminal processing protease